MNDASGITPVGYLDCSGGGQVVVRVCTDARGLLDLIHRHRGLHILERR